MVILWGYLINVERKGNKKYNSVKPGLTGYWQVSGRNNVKEVLRNFNEIGSINFAYCQDNFNEILNTFLNDISKEGSSSSLGCRNPAFAQFLRMKPSRSRSRKSLEDTIVKS